MSRLAFTLPLLFTFLLLNAQTLERRTAIDIPFADSPVPAAPDYTDLNNWSSLPEKEDMSDLVPKQSDLVDGQANADVDVFYIHPTTLLSGPEWNANLADAALNKKTDDLPVKYQSTVFNGSCKIYAPRYRQAHVRAFFNVDEGGREALMLAYSDVKKAFEYYMEHYNNGRPFIIASHSQGTLHATFLIKDMIEGTPLQDKLVAAYIIGFPVRDTTFKVLKPCNNPSETGCFISYGTYAENYYPEYYNTFLKDAIMVNPVSWTMDTTAVSYSVQKGYVGRRFAKPRAKTFGARIKDNMLWVTKPHMFMGSLLKMKDFHIADYNLFWMDIRENVALRCKTYLENGTQTNINQP
jgi:hypothetical protein